MSINKHAYDTAVCGSVILSKLQTEIRKAFVMGSLHTLSFKQTPLSESVTIALVEGGNAEADSISFFSQPLPVVHEGQTFLAVDVRNFGYWKGPQHVFSVRNTIEYSWHLKRACLTAAWNNDQVQRLRDVSDLPMMAYASLISQSIARRFALDPVEKDKVAAICAYFYLCLFTDEQEFDEMAGTRIKAKIIRSIRTSEKIVSDTLTDNNTIHGIGALCTIIKEKLNNPALKDLNPGLLVQVVSRTWMGVSSEEIVGVGLEHVPTWMMVVYSSMSSQTYRRTTLAKLVQELDKKGIGQSYVQAIEMILGGKEAVLEEIIGLGPRVFEDYSSNF